MLGIVAIVLGVVFEKINVAFMVGLAFAVAASANFPVLLLSMLWKGLTTRGAFIGGFVGLICAVVLTIFSPGIWVAVLGFSKEGAWFPYTSPAHLQHAARVPVLLVLLDHRQVGGGRSGAGGVRRAIRALADRHRRREGGRALRTRRKGEQTKGASSAAGRPSLFEAVRRARRGEISPGAHAAAP